MDVNMVIQGLMHGRDVCICSCVGNHMQTKCAVALVEHGADHGLFIYSVVRVPCSKPDDLKLNKVLPVDANLSLKTASISACAVSVASKCKCCVMLLSAIVSNHSTGEGMVVVIRIESLHVSMVFELLHGDQLTTLLATIKDAKQVYSQTAAFGLPSDFAWIHEYTASQVNTSNPFALDVFDPLASSDKLHEWPYSLITQPTHAQPCPVVKDVDRLTVNKPQSSGSIKKNNSSHDLSSASTESVDGRLHTSDSRWNTVRRANEVCNAVSSKNEPMNAASQSRDFIANLLMRDRQDDYVDLKKYRVFCGTWNVNGQSSASCDLKHWLSPEGEEPPDIYAVGFQELDLSKNAYIFAASPREEEWFNKVSEGLNPKAKYRKLRLVRLVGIMLVVYVRDSLISDIRDLSDKTVGTGLLGMMGNKGGVAVRFRLHDTALCFVNSHLAAHTEEVEGRNQDFRDINAGMKFDDRPSTISEHDIVFWIGDLNYRICDIDSDECKKMIKQNQLADLRLNYDQLHHQIAQKRAFHDYAEGYIGFKPTYKYDPGTDEWDSSDKCRTPAWCDRILWRGDNVTHLTYRSHPQLRLSDHKPVSAVFDLGVKVIDRIREKKVREDVMKILDQKENEYLPQIKLDTTEVRFNNVKFYELQQRSIIITNTGQVPVQFEFINKLSDSHFCKPWLSIDPSHGFMHVGEELSIQLEVYVDKRTAPLLTSGKDLVDDILILHLQGGKDFFVTVIGNYLPSCFGSSIEDLVRRFKPIREAESASLIDVHSPKFTSKTSCDTSKPLDIPKELWRLVDFIFNNGLHQAELFQLPGSHLEITHIRDSLDTGCPASLPGSVHSVAEALLILIESFSEPVIPYAYYSQCLTACNNFILCKQILSLIPVAHRNVFKYICAFLRKLLQFTQFNNIEPKFLATLFGSLLLRPPASEVKPAQTAEAASKSREESRKRATFVHQFLTHEYDE